jgi:cytochrome c oxidase cbb3-type subunit 4
MSTYEMLSHWVASWGFIYFALIFAGAIFYALLPRNRETFDKAARVPLDED